MGLVYCLINTQEPGSYNITYNVRASPDGVRVGITRKVVVQPACSEGEVSRRCVFVQDVGELLGRVEHIVLCSRAVCLAAFEASLTCRLAVFILAGGVRLRGVQHGLDVPRGQV